MGTRVFKPVTPGTRFRSVSDFAEITKSVPERALLEPLRRTGGRNNKGHVTTRHQGGGHKRRFRRIDFRRDKNGVPAKIVGIEYDPNRTARIALLCYADGEKRYMLAPKVSGSATRSSPGQARISASGTRYRCSRSRWGRPYTMSSSRSDAAASFAARPARGCRS